MSEDTFSALVAETKKRLSMIDQEPVFHAGEEFRRKFLTAVEQLNEKLNTVWRK